ncbi:MAG: lasso peptide isopeptide bond-forming cyclase [Anaerolineae bacterium]|nr:lasso peptide isopeptide bond-forming cyclase [Anaerolineae bacterium]
MSAIAGVLYPDGRPADQAQVKRMAEILAHRGPDGGAVWVAGSVGLGQRMLYTTPESLQEKLPWVDATEKLVITADARIDNRADLILALKLTGRPPSAIADSQLILAAYAKWGERCPEQFLGDFAFAIWDARKQTLFCARDHFGVKPFYYFHAPGRLFAFASEIKALLCLPEVPRGLNEVRVADHLARIFKDKTSTFYQDILRLPPAHSLTVGDGKIQLRAYWSLDPFREVRLPSDAAYTAAFRELFTEAVRCRLRSAFPVGSTLSGGLDSSAVACMSRQLLAAAGGKCLHTFSAIFPGLPETDLPQIDERRYIQAILAGGGFEPHYVQADRLSPLADLERVFWHEDEAFLAPNLYMHWALYGAAQQENVRILLDGLDGDTTVSHGLGYLAELARTGKWKTLVSEAAALSQRAHASVTARQIVWQYGFRPLVPAAAVRACRLLRRRPSRPTGAANEIVNPVLAQRVRLAERIQTLQVNGSGPAYTARAIHWHGLTSALMPYTLELADKAAAAFSLEARYPFFDRRLVEFCLALPPQQKLRHGWSRVIMRRAMAGILPEAVQWRFGKANLSPNFKRRLLDCDRKTLDAVILHRPELIQAYVDIPVLHAAYQHYTSQPMQAEEDALTIYGVVILALWLQKSSLAP